MERTGVVATKVDASALQVDGDRLRGQVEVWTNFDDDSALYRAVYKLDLPVAEGRIAEGEYSGQYSVRTRTVIYDTDELLVTPEDVRLFAYGDPIRGGVDGEVHAPVVDTKPARFLLRTMHILEGPASWTRYVWIEFELHDGEVRDLTFLPRKRHRDTTTWTADIEEAEFTFEDGQLEGKVTAELTGGSPRTHDGTYTLHIEGRVSSNNEVTGSVTRAERNGQRIGSSGLTGDAHGIYEADEERVYVLKMPAAIAADDDLYVHLRYGDGRFQEGVAMHRDLADRFDVNVEDLRLEGNRISGSMPVHFDPESPAITADEPFTVDYRIDARIKDGEKVAGDYEAKFGPVEQVAGSAQVRVHSDDDLRQRHAIAEGKDWPAWSGPGGGFSAVPSGHDLVDRLDDARLLWKSEHTPPGRMQVRRYGAGGTIRRYLERGGPAGGGSSPVVADGIVYFYYPRPDLESEDIAGHVDDWINEGRHTFGPELWAIDGEDVVIAIDAATGQTLWKTVVPGGTYSWGFNAKINYTAMSTVGGGRVYVRAKNRTLGLDAETGEFLWINTEHGGRLPVALDDMAVFSGDDVTALDAETGEVRWRIRNAGSDRAIPVHWVHDGESYILSGNSGGRIVCIRAEDGELMWEIEDAGDNSRSMVLSGDHLLVSVGDDGDRLGAYRISPDGAEKAWSLSGDYRHRPARMMPAAQDGLVFFQTYGWSPAKLLVVDITDGDILHEVDTRRSSSGHVHRVEDRLLVQEDASHSRAHFDYAHATEDRAEQIGPRWRPPHSGTSGYYPYLATHPIADGRIFIRGERGIYCYDLRAED